MPTVAVRPITEAMIGPAQGAHNRPSPAPTTRPTPNPPCRWWPAPMRASGAKNRSTHSPRAGMSRVRPNTPNRTIAPVRSHTVGKANACAAAVTASVAAVKVTANPSTMPRGRERPPPVDVESRIGSTGNTQGEITVTTPARKANSSRISILQLYQPPLTKAAPIITRLLQQQSLITYHASLSEPRTCTPYCYASPSTPDSVISPVARSRSGSAPCAPSQSAGPALQ